MKKVMIVVFLAAVAIFSNCSRIQGTRLSDSSLLRTAEPAPPDTTAVTVFFSGLMVFHREDGKPNYEVGIVRPEVARDHKFSVRVDSDTIHNLPEGTSWILEITNSPQTPNIPPVEVGHGGKRRPDNINGQFDFSWLIDLESPEFHNKELDLKPGLLWPIIHLPNGRLYTRYKSVDLKRSQGTGTASDFGFVPETIALQVELHQGQELVLKDAKPDGKEAFRLKYHPPSSPHSGYSVYITNLRPHSRRDSDFALYYQLFNGIDKEDQYDFKPHTDTKEHPHNSFPGYVPGHVFETCCAMACTEVLLGTRKNPLE